MRRRRLFEIGFEEANFLHRVHWSILDPEFVDNDIGFINSAFPNYIRRLGSHLTKSTARLMIEFYDLVPENKRPELTWHPNPELRHLAK